MEPLGAAVGLTIRDDPVISEDGYYGHEREALDLLAGAAPTAPR
jgi:hypothetical protein